VADELAASRRFHRALQLHRDRAIRRSGAADGRGQRRSRPRTRARSPDASANRLGCSRFETPLDCPHCQGRRFPARAAGQISDWKNGRSARSDIDARLLDRRLAPGMRGATVPPAFTATMPATCSTRREVRLAQAPTRPIPVTAWPGRLPQSPTRALPAAGEQALPVEFTNCRVVPAGRAAVMPALR